MQTGHRGFWITALALASAACAVQGTRCWGPPFYPDKADLLCYLDDRDRRVPVRTPADWKIRRAHVFDGFGEVAGPAAWRPDRAPPQVTVNEEVRLPGIVRRRITFDGMVGDRVPAYLLIPEGPARRRPAMICLHQTIACGKDEPAGLGGSPDLHYAKELAERGYVTLAPDYPNFGDYRLDVYAAGYASATMKGIDNHRRAVDVLQSLPEVDGDRIGVIGHSLGGHNAIFLAVFDPRVKVAVTSCGFTSFPKYMKGDLTGWSHAGYLPRIAEAYGKDPARMPFDFPELLAAIAPRPVFVNAPLHDGNFDVGGVRDCVDAARKVYALLGAPEALVAEHPDAGHAFPPDVRARAYAFLDRTLGGNSP